MNKKDPTLIANIFDRLAGKYDILNDIFSFGIHRFWKREMLRMLNPRPGQYWLDLCCGTGDLTFRLARYVRPGGYVLGIDFSAQALQVARKRYRSKSFLPISLEKKDVLNNSLSSYTFDGISMAYGLRNLSNPRQGLSEIYRLLKPGGKAAVLDFSRMKKGSLGDRFQKLYLSKFVVPFSSRLGLGKEYSYIQESLETFPTGIEQRSIAKDLGFGNAEYKLLAAGQMGILLLES
tara:strand:+ start:1616 stop:2317 length:702 start_codon:yes stop_codon:yes gene_type:complete